MVRTPRARRLSSNAVSCARNRPVYTVPLSDNDIDGMPHSAIPASITAHTSAASAAPARGARPPRSASGHRDCPRCPPGCHRPAPIRSNRLPNSRWADRNRTAWSPPRPLLRLRSDQYAAGSGSATPSTPTAPRHPRAATTHTIDWRTRDRGRSRSTVCAATHQVLDLDRGPSREVSGAVTVPAAPRCRRRGNVDGTCRTSHDCLVVAAVLRHVLDLPG